MDTRWIDNGGDELVFSLSTMTGHMMEMFSQTISLWKCQDVTSYPVNGRLVFRYSLEDNKCVIVS